ncbi:MAG: hypothetical protein WAM14_24515 [Candidatus Nitrosopolaris sp.]
MRRRHLNEFQGGELGYILEGIEKEMAKKRYAETLYKADIEKAAAEKRLDKEKQPMQYTSEEAHGTPTPPSIPTTTEPQPRRGMSQHIAKRVGISHATYERTKKIIEKGNEPQKNELRKGTVGIRKIYSQIKREVPSETWHCS